MDFFNNNNYNNNNNNKKADVGIPSNNYYSLLEGASVSILKEPAL